MSCNKCKKKLKGEDYEWNYLCEDDEFDNKGPPYCDKCSTRCSYCPFYSALIIPKKDTPSQCSVCNKFFCSYHLHWDVDGSGDIYDGKVYCVDCVCKHT
jgi:hypothetical protein